MNIQMENKEICAKCGGFCCKKSGCDYSIKDFESLKIDYLQSKLEEGYISIVSAQDFLETKDGKIINSPFLYLRARNINRPIIDLLSMKTTCKSLEKNGCRYNLENRPSGGVNLIPADGNKSCYPLIPPLEIVKEWQNYQKILARLVKRMTGKSVQENLKIDVENLFYDCFSKNFEGVMDIEIQDILEMLPLLAKAYPEEYKKAKARYNQNKLRVLKK